MADKNSSEKSVDSIQDQIRKLLEEKDELERMNREKQQLEQRLMRENATRIGSISGAGVSPGDRRSFGSNRDYGDLNPSLTESQHHRRSFQQNINNSSMDGAPSKLDDSVESQRSADDAEDDDVMLPEHKQALRANRDILVENMTPDDIFNDLISKHILTNADISRIKERNTTEAINEELLNVLIRRSDRAFHVFVASLRRTLQGWLANRLDPGSPQKNKRKRRTGEINISLNCEKVIPISRKNHACTCQEVEEQVLIMAKAAFTHIRRRDGTSAAFEQFKKELKQTNEVLKESMEILHTLKMLCRHGEITDMTEGSVCFTIRCTSLASCQELWAVYESGVLLQAFQKGLVTSTFLHICRAKQIHLCLRISRLEYVTCALELAYKEIDAPQLRQSKSMPVKKRLKRKLSSVQKENTSGEVPKVFRHSKGQAFQEIPMNTISSLYHVHGQGFINKCDKFTSISQIQGSSKFSTTHEAPEKNSLSKEVPRQHTAATEEATGNNIWLRSCVQGVQSYYKREFSQTGPQSSKLDHVKIASQDRKKHIENDSEIQQDVCPYYLRYRLMNS